MWGIRGNQSFVYHTENGLSCVEWNMPQLNCRDHGAAVPSLQPEREGREGGTRPSVSGIIFQVLQTENCLTSWLVTYRRHQNCSLFLHLGWCTVVIAFSLLRILPGHIFLLRVTTGKLQLWTSAQPPHQSSAQ